MCEANTPSPCACVHTRESKSFLLGYKQEGKPMKDCVSHTGLYDDWDNPLDEKGRPYLPGKRFCGHRDCVNPDHIEGLSDEQAYAAYVNQSARSQPSRAGKKRNYPENRLRKQFAHIVHAQVMEIGRLPNQDLKICMIDKCERPKKARNLCMNHWLMFRYRAPSELKAIRQITLSDFPELLPAINRSQRNKVEERQNQQCIFTDCTDFQKVRGLCKRHYATFKNLQRRSK